MSFEWIAMEHHRLHIVEEWADGPHKEAALAAIHSTLEGLLRNQRPNMNLPACEICLGRTKVAPLRFPEVFPIEHVPADLAA
jgi:hypothetical protein